jgi:hypothetical protein
LHLVLFLQLCYTTEFEKRCESKEELKMEQKIDMKTGELKKTGNTPEIKFRAGGISATVWQNSIEKDGEKSSFNTISLDRAYKDKAGNWQTTNSFRPNDLPRLSLVAQKAYEYVVCKSAEV